MYFKYCILVESGVFIMSKQNNYTNNNYSFVNSEDFEDAMDNLAEQYILIYIQVSQLLKDYFDSQNLDGISFPIDFYGLAKWLGIEVKLTDLNYFRFSKFSIQLGKLEMENNKVVIYLEKRASPLSARYALAHEISHYLCNHNNVYCLESKLPANREELIIDIVTSFLVLPPELTFTIAWDFTQNNLRRPVDLNEILLYLSKMAKMPYYRTITAYEHLKTVACYLRTVQSREKILEMIQKDMDKILKKNSEWKEPILEKLEALDSIAKEEFFA